jgi:hypothetical protein
MTDDLEQRLRRELNGSRYALVLDPDKVLARVSGPERRTRPAVATLTAAAAAIAVAGAVTAGFLLPGRTTQDAPAPPAATATASPTSAWSGLPPGLAPAEDVAGAAGRAPALAGVPSGGIRSAYLGADNGDVWRLVVVIDGGITGLPGTPLDVPAGWAPDGSQLLLTSDGETTYAKVYRIDGRNFCLAVSGGSPDQRMAALKRLILENVTG